MGVRIQGVSVVHMIGDESGHMYLHMDSEDAV